MNNVKQLKIVLVIVLVLGIAFSGYYATKYQALSSEVAGFSDSIQTVKSEQEAKVSIGTFLDTVDSQSLASSAYAKKDNGSCNWWCKIKKALPFVDSGMGAGGADGPASDDTNGVISGGSLRNGSNDVNLGQSNFEASGGNSSYVGGLGGVSNQTLNNPCTVNEWTWFSCNNPGLENANNSTRPRVVNTSGSQESNTPSNSTGQTNWTEPDPRCTSFDSDC